MKLHILKETFELENKEDSIEKIFDYIKQAIEETEYNFSHMVVDGEEIYDEFELYLEDNIKSIDEVKVVMLTIEEMISDNLHTISEYVEGAIPLINDLADKFYRQPNAEDWIQITDLFEGLGFILDILENIDNMENLNDLVASYEVWNEYVVEVKLLDEIVKELNTAIENSDTVLIGDLLSHEIVPVFEKMKTKLDILIATN